jgi:cobalt-zinc-cadmium efflux system outer membrane protein
MQLDRSITICLLVLAALGPGRCPAENGVRKLPKPPRSEHEESLAPARWIQKDLPPAPLPPSVSAPAPAPRVIPFPTEPRAAPGRPGMTLAEAEQIALENNPTLVQAAMGVRAAEGNCLQAGLYPNPVAGYHAEEIGIEGSAGQHGMFFGQQLVTGGKLQLRSAVRNHEVEQAEHAWQAQRLRVLTDVRSAWYEVLVAQRIVQLNEHLVLIGQQGVKTAGDLLKGKEVSRVDLLQARIEADSATLQLHDARNRHLATWRRLAAVLGVPGMEPTPLAGDLENDLPDLNWEDALRDLLTFSPELAEAYSGVRRARSEVTRQCAEWIPDVDVRAGVRYHDADQHTVAGLEIGLPLPIFNRNQGNICKAQAELVAAENEVQRVELALQQRLAAAFERYAQARYEVEKYALEILPNARKSLNLVQSGYEDAEFDYLTLLTAQRTYFRVSLAYMKSLLECRASSVAIEGFLLTGSLQ